MLVFRVRLFHALSALIALVSASCAEPAATEETESANTEADTLTELKARVQAALVGRTLKTTVRIDFSVHDRLYDPRWKGVVSFKLPYPVALANKSFAHTACTLVREPGPDDLSRWIPAERRYRVASIDVTERPVLDAGYGIHDKIPFKMTLKNADTGYATDFTVDSCSLYWEDGLPPRATVE